ncbi:hypothetical protein D3C76_1393700 [compost metagenome]
MSVSPNCCCPGSRDREFRDAPPAPFSPPVNSEAAGSSAAVMIPLVATELIATPAANTSEIIFFPFNFKTIPPQLQHKFIQSV